MRPTNTPNAFKPNRHRFVVFIQLHMQHRQPQDDSEGFGRTSLRVGSSLAFFLPGKMTCERDSGGPRGSSWAARAKNQKGTDL